MIVNFFYVDIGRSWWGEATRRLVQTAHDVMPGCTVRQLSDAKTAPVDGVSMMVQSQQPIEQSVLMMAKGYMWSVEALRATEPTLFVDADIEFQHDLRPLYAGDWDVGLIRRPQTGRGIAMPYLAAMAMSKPTPGAVAFWTEYQHVLTTLPPVLHPWWCDQLAFALVLGTLSSQGDAIQTDAFHVKLFDADVLAPHEANPDAYTVHYKGRHNEKKAAA